MPRYKITLEYDGTNYAGWQRQPDRFSIQEALENAAFLFCGEKVQVHGAGRTDAGVHATAQCAHLDIPKEMDAFHVMQGLNFHLFTTEGNRIAINAAQRVDDEFHARFSATGRRYLYRIINRRARLGLDAGRAWHVIEPLDEQAMQEAANHLLGKHDFTSFRDTQCQAKSPLKTLDELTITRHGNELHIIAAARSFLHHQVRIMVGSLGLVGKGKWSPDDMKNALEACDRTKGGPTAPPEGLYLTHVDY